MSQSRKKIKKLQKQRKQKRQETAQRREKSFRQHAEQVHDEVMDDMMPLVSRIGGLSTGSRAGMDELMMTIMDTYDLADEPEMTGILFDPMLATESLGKAVEKLGFSPEKMEALSQEEREDAQLEMQEECAKMLLTAETCQDILKRLDNLRLRLKRSGKKKETAKVAALLSFLREDKKRGSWPMIGLVLALIQRHIDLSFALMDVAIAAVPEGKDETDILDARAMKKPGALKKFKALLKTPGLRDYLEQKVEKTWEEGMDALFAGDLIIHVYTVEELEASYGLFAKASGFDSAEAMDAAGPSRKFTDEKAKELIQQLEIYIAKIFTKARIKQLRERIDTLLKDPEHTGKWAPFLAMLKEHLEDKKAVEYEMKFFISALFGEIRTIAKESEIVENSPDSE